MMPCVYVKSYPGNNKRSASLVYVKPIFAAIVYLFDDISDIKPTFNQLPLSDILNLMITIPGYSR